MTKEEKIRYALAFLAPLLFENRHDPANKPIRITFSSSHKAEIENPDGTTQIVKFELPFRLYDALHQIVDYNITEECKDWERCVHEEYEEDMFEEVEGDIVYDPELVADHVYHHLHFCEELIEGYFK
jgi:hypothetical protein